jgi:hypothetical protein
MLHTKLFFVFLIFLVTFKVAGQTTILPLSSSWKYLDNGSNQGIAWRSTSFNDSNWNIGNAKFGYGISDANTIVGFGPSPSKKYITTYFRNNFTINDLSKLASATGKLYRDDGAVVYINGIEVFRNNLPSGTVSFTTLATDAKDNGTSAVVFNVNPSVLVNGTNVIAVEIHQSKANSPDIAFDLELTGTVISTGDNTPPSVLGIERSSPSNVITNSSSVTYRAVFSEPVSGVDRTDFVVSATSGSISGILSTNAVSAVGTNGTTYDVTVSQVSGNGTLRLDLKASGTGITDQAGNAISGGYASGQTYTVDQTVPLLSTVSISSNNVNSSIASVGNTITLNFAATEKVEIPVITIASKSVTVAPGNNNTFVASYTLTDSDSEGIVPFSIDFTDLAGNAGAKVTVTTNGSSVNYTKTAPSVLSINRYSPTTSSTSASSLTYRATFSVKVNGVDKDDFLLTTLSGSVSATLAANALQPVGTDGTTYDVTVSQVSGNGTLRLDLKASGTGITDQAGNAISGGYASGQTYTIEQASSEPPGSITLVPFNATWKYLDNGSNQGTTWRSTSFNDGSWKSGNGKFGYGISDASTTVSFGPDPNNKYITTYFRKTVSIANASSFTYYTANIKRDDGVVVYVNGSEVYRNNISTTRIIEYNTLAYSAQDNGTVPQTFTIKSSAFTSGNNVIAVEVHQAGLNSSDLAFDFELIGGVDPLPPIFTRGPYLQIGNQTGVTLRWRTDSPSDSKIEVGTSFGSYNLSATNPVLTTDHEVRIEGLTANTKYFYRFGSSAHILEANASNFFKTAPPASTTGKIKVAVFGDCGADNFSNRSGSLNSYLKHTGSNPAELLLLLGDNAYNNGSDAEYQKEFFNPFQGNILKNHILFPAPGNHEYDTGTQASRDVPYYQNFSMPTAGECGGVASGTKAFYSFDWGNIHFISLDSYGTEADKSRLYDTLGVQVTWLKKDLAANTKPWVVVYFHHAPYSLGSRNADTDSEMSKIRQNFIRILERYGVDLVLTGHSHNYERSYLLNKFYGTNSTFNLATHTKSSSSAKYDGSSNSCPYVISSSAKNHGTVYVVAGSSGAGSSTVQSGYPHKALPFSVNDGGMLYLEVEGNRLDAKMLRKDGSIFDNFTIMQDVNRTTSFDIIPGSSTQLTASWVGNYKWSNGATTRSITVNPTSTTTYQVTDNINCLTDVFQVNTNFTATGSKGILQKGYELEEENLDAHKVYPTLAKRGSAINIHTDESEAVDIYLTDITGRLYYTSKFTGNIILDTKDLPHGMYFITLHGTKELKKYKFIISH